MSGLYLLLNEFGSFKEYDLAIMYFGLEALFCSAYGYIGSKSDKWISKQFTQIHSMFIAFRGIIYVLHYSGYEIGNLERLIYICLFSLIMIVTFNLKCYFYGYYNDKEN
jgi:hypothetical protein